MKKIILTFILGLSAAGSCFAQNNMQAMRFLTINSLLQYGQKLYDRGDYNEATAVFNHVLTFDSHQVQALEYLKEMGYAPASLSSLPVQNKVDIANTEGLKQAIEAKKQSIEKLRAQIMQMRAIMASQSAEE